MTHNLQTMIKTSSQNILAAVRQDAPARLAYRYRIYPTKAQVSVLERTLGICRAVYNSLVHERTVLYETTGKPPNYLRQKMLCLLGRKTIPNSVMFSRRFCKTSQNELTLRFKPFSDELDKAKNLDTPG